MERFSSFIKKYVMVLSFPQITPIDIIEIIILTFLIYQIIKWIKNTRAWMLSRGILVVAAFYIIAAVFRMNTILYIANKTINVGIIAVIIVFQPEFRTALEQLGRKNIVTSFFSAPGGKNQEVRFTDFTIDEIVRASFEMGKVKTGALIVVEQNVALGEYERTGIELDALVSGQLLINIFEHNTPLHDGAIIIRGDRIVSATCYLPLSDSMRLSKALGTRHRAGVGLSEVADALVIIVSEETGAVSLAFGGELIRNIDADYLRAKLAYIQKRSIDVKKLKLWKGRENS